MVGNSSALSLQRIHDSFAGEEGPAAPILKCLRFLSHKSNERALLTTSIPKIQHVIPKFPTFKFKFSQQHFPRLWITWNLTTAKSRAQQYRLVNPRHCATFPKINIQFVGITVCISSKFKRFHAQPPMQNRLRHTRGFLFPAPTQRMHNHHL